MPIRRQSKGGWNTESRIDDSTVVGEIKSNRKWKYIMTVKSIDIQITSDKICSDVLSAFRS